LVWANRPDWFAIRIGKEAGVVNEATVRSIIKRFGPELVANNAQEVPKDAQRSGRPLVRTERWQRSVYRPYWPP
jgi:hypothetical protein